MSALNRRLYLAYSLINDLQIAHLTRPGDISGVLKGLKSILLLH